MWLFSSYYYLHWISSYVYSLVVVAVVGIASIFRSFVVICLLHFVYTKSPYTIHKLVDSSRIFACVTIAGKWKSAFAYWPVCVCVCASDCANVSEWDRKWWKTDEKCLCINNARTMHNILFHTHTHLHTIQTYRILYAMLRNIIIIIMPIK